MCMRVCDQASNALIGWLPVFHSLSQTIDMTGQPEPSFPMNFGGPTGEA